MKVLRKALRGFRYALFIDLEATQREAELIELGAVLAKLDDEGRIAHVYEGLRTYVKASHAVGPIVRRLTGISDFDLAKKGIPFEEAIEELKHYLGKKASECIYISYGSNDIRILEQSYSFHQEADIHFIRLIKKNYLDFLTFLGRFLHDEHGNPYSLSNALKVFGLDFNGQKHDALYDAKALLELYDAFAHNPPILLEEYRKNIARGTKLPEPIRRLLDRLMKEGHVDLTDFDETVKEALE